jgi:preprotein translocase subunit SecA
VGGALDASPPSVGVEVDRKGIARMDKLEKIWENTSSALQGMLSGIERGITGIFGSSNARQIKRFQSKISQINALETKLESLSDAELRDMTAVMRKRLG